MLTVANKIPQNVFPYLSCPAIKHSAQCDYLTFILITNVALQSPLLVRFFLRIPHTNTIYLTFPSISGKIDCFPNPATNKSFISQ